MLYGKVSNIMYRMDIANLLLIIMAYKAVIALVNSFKPPALKGCSEQMSKVK